MVTKGLREEMRVKKGNQKGVTYPFESNSMPVTSRIFGRKSAACSAGNLRIILLVSDSMTDT